MPLPKSNGMAMSLMLHKVTVMPAAAHYDLYSPTGCRLNLQTIVHVGRSTPLRATRLVLGFYR